MTFISVCIVAKWLYPFEVHYMNYSYFYSFDEGHMRLLCHNDGLCLFCSTMHVNISGRPDLFTIYVPSWWLDLASPSSGYHDLYESCYMSTELYVAFYHCAAANFCVQYLFHCMKIRILGVKILLHYLTYISSLRYHLSSICIIYFLVLLYLFIQTISNLSSESTKMKWLTTRCLWL